MRLKERFLAAIKGFAGGFDWVNSELPGNRFTSAVGRAAYVPLTGINWSSLSGDAYECPAVQAIINWLWRNLPQAIPMMYRKEQDGSRTALPDHPFLKIISRPNPDYDWTVLLQGVSLSILSNPHGSAFVSIERMRSGQLISSDGKSRGELRYRPHQRVSVISPPDDPETVTEYLYNDGKSVLHIPPEEMMHWRFGIDPHDVRQGLGSLASAGRDVTSLQQDSSYRANILRNFGTVGGFLWPEDPNVNIDPEMYARLYQQKTTGDRVGEIFVSDVPLHVEFPKTSPQDMALDTISDRPEANISAQTGIPPQVAGLHVGRLSKTYANAQQAKESAWEEGAMPLLILIASQMWHKLGPMVSPDTYEEEEFSFDFSKIRALQPDLDALFRRANDSWKLNLIDRARWKTMVGETPTPEDEGVYYASVAGGPQLPDSIPSTVQGDVPVKRLDWADRVIQELEEMHEVSR